MNTTASTNYAILPTATRRANRSGKRATVWVAA